MTEETGGADLILVNNLGTCLKSLSLTISSVAIERTTLSPVVILIAINHLTRLRKRWSYLVRK